MLSLLLNLLMYHSGVDPVRESLPFSSSMFTSMFKAEAVDRQELDKLKAELKAAKKEAAEMSRRAEEAKEYTKLLRK